KRIAGIRISAKTNQAINSGARRSRQESGRVHGARAAWSNRNAGCRRRGRAGNRSYSSAHARGSGAWSSGGNANMNLADGTIGAVRRFAKTFGTAARPNLHVCWLGRKALRPSPTTPEEPAAE